VDQEIIKYLIVEELVPREFVNNAIIDIIFLMDFVIVLVHYAMDGTQIMAHAQPVSADIHFLDMVVFYHLKIMDTMTTMTAMTTIDNLIDIKNFVINRYDKKNLHTKLMYQ
jgi:hypothetical protein